MMRNRFSLFVMLVALCTLCACPEPESPDNNIVVGERTRGKSYTDKPRKGARGWRWRGNRDQCFYLLDKKCFKTEKAACKAANCGKRSCETDDSMPAIVTCTKKR